MSCQKPVLKVRLGTIARVAPPEETKAIARNEFIHAIAQRARQHAPCRGKLPWPAEPLGNPDGTLGFEPGAAVGEQDHGLVILRVEAVMDIERVAERRLRRQE